MKPIYALTAMAGVLALMNSPLSAQEKLPLEPSADNAPKAADALPPAAEEKERDKPDAPAPSRSGPPARGTRTTTSREEMTPYIGVLTSHVPRELRAHFNLPEGFGLLVQEVMPDTPAKAAGIQMDDVLLRFEDQKLVNMEQLQTLVRSQKKGDVVRLTLISGGQEKQVSVTIAERLMQVARGEEGRQGEEFFPRMGPLNPFFGGRDDFDMKDMREAMERYQKHMREYQERMRDWNRNGRQGGAQPPAPPTWSGPSRRGGEPERGREADRDRNDRDRERSREPDRSSSPPRGGEPERRTSPSPERRESRYAANVTRSDDSGIYSLRREGDRTVFTAKPKDGEEKSWNLNSDAERRAIPDHLKEKLRQLEEIRGEDMLRR